MAHWDYLRIEYWPGERKLFVSPGDRLDRAWIVQNLSSAEVVSDKVLGPVLLELRFREHKDAYPAYFALVEHLADSGWEPFSATTESAPSMILHLKRIR